MLESLIYRLAFCFQSEARKICEKSPPRVPKGAPRWLQILDVNADKLLEEETRRGFKTEIPAYY